MTPEERAHHFIAGIGGVSRSEAAQALAYEFRQVENDALERAAKKAATFFPKAHTYASENADIYRAQDYACLKISTAIRALKHKP